ncbi:YoaK family protein [Acinetobacter rathckeae]|uniref:YoaK family protein n=1 Tax=Acinetobacter rathckeae TaxID=2605272 RepID=UPI0018A2A69E|nr:YoaK family protein [Acinetobacter rathckeae]MBF7688933.1 DUF1275 domain-containing protein [Acinetobacter rathckeae]MBF7696332.1 DUF1275 domain-containing protein [Acinetobacter rathckeae]
MQRKLPIFLSFNAGYVDTASFLSIGGLFAAHVTGNFVTLGYSLVTNTQSATLAKLFALPMFCFAVLISKVIDQYFLRHQKLSYSFLLKFKFFLYLLAAFVSEKYIPFSLEYSWPAFTVGMLLIFSMGIQNAIHRLYWIKEAPTTVMTGSTTQLMVDLGSIITKDKSVDRVAMTNRFKKVLPQIISFTIGCASAGLIYHFYLKFILFIPPILMIAIYFFKNDYQS